MRQISGVMLILLILSASTPLNAQPGSRRFMGLGISIDPTKFSQTNYLFSPEVGFQTIQFTNVSPIVFYVPMDITGTFRLEPLFGLNSMSSSSTTSSTQQGGGYPYTTSSDVSITTVGIRGAYISPLSNSFGLYIGPRCDFSFVYSKLEYSYNYTGSKTTTKETDVTVGAFVGSEYFPISEFSVGGEVSFNYIWFGNPRVTYESIPPQPTTTSTERKQHRVHTEALFFVRWYFLQLTP